MLFDIIDEKERPTVARLILVFGVGVFVLSIILVTWFKNSDLRAFASLIQAASVVGVLWGVLETREQINLQKQIARQEFENTLYKEYRELMSELSYDVVSGWDYEKEIEHGQRDTIYTYIDLCNEQVVLRMNDEITDGTWDNWSEGIKSNLKKEPFLTVWDDVWRETDDFDELRMFQCDRCEEDPIDWSGGECEHKTDPPSENGNLGGK